MQLIKRMKVVPVDEGIYMMLNGLTGTLDLIDEPVYQLYLSWKECPDIKPTDSPEMYHNFLNRGYLMEPGGEEAKLQEIFDKLEAGLNSVRPRVEPTFLLTYNCNFRCPYCYEKHLQEKGKEFLQQRMTPEIINGFFASFDEQKMTIGDITLYGGEPLLPSNLDTIKAILAEANARDLAVNVITNGYTLDEYAPLLATAKIRGIQVTIDGDRERHNHSRYLANGQGTFDKIISGLLKAKEYELPIIIRCNIEIDEDGQVDQLLQALEGTGLKEYKGFQLYIAPVASAESKYKCGHEFLKEYLKKVETHLESPIVTKEILRKIHKVATNFLNPEKWSPTYVYCGAHVGQQVFDPMGQIYPCQIFVGEKEQAIGNFDEFGQIKYNDNFTRWQSRTVQNMEKCRDCETSLFCGGGCGMRSIKDSGDLYTPNCESAQELMDSFLPFLYQHFLKD